MKIQEAYDKGLLIIGTMVVCNGSNGITCGSYSGILYDVDIFKDYISIKRDDRKTGNGKDDTWKVWKNSECDIFLLITVDITIVKHFTDTLAEAIYNGKKVYVKSKTMYNKGKHTMVGYFVKNVMHLYK